MGNSIYETIENMLRSVQEEIDDPDLVFKLRTARQLNIACKEDHSALQHTLEDTDLTEETKARLRDLGYLSRD